MSTVIFFKDGMEIRVPHLIKSPTSDRVFWDIYKDQKSEVPDMEAGLKAAVAAKAIKRLRDKTAWRYGNCPFQIRYGLIEGWTVRWEETNEG